MRGLPQLLSRAKRVRVGFSASEPVLAIQAGILQPDKFTQTFVQLRGLQSSNVISQAPLAAVADTDSGKQLRQELEAIVGPGNVSSGESVVLQHGQDEGPHPGKSPDIVVFPSSTEEVSEICKICTKHNIPIIPYGTGTGLEGGISAVDGGVCVNVSKNMNKILQIHQEDFSAVVQPGISREMLNQEVRADGLWFPVDPGADASVCGMCATGASGTNAVRYGTMKENCLNLEVVLADGRIIHTAGIGSRPKKSSAGYNLTSLFLGSEGTLGIITSATVCLHAIPESVAAAVVGFPTVQNAVDTVVMTLQCSVPMARMELLDEVQMKACNEYSGLSYPETPHLFLEFHGSESEVESQTETVRDIAADNDGGEFQWAVQQEDRTKLWTARHRAYYADIALRPGCRSLTTDVCVPVSALPDLVTATKADIAEHGLIGPMVGHVGDGNFHTMLLFDPADPEEFRKCKEVANKMARSAIALGGTCTGEHGVGQGKMVLLEEQFGKDGIDVMRQIKGALDPQQLMNPGKVFSRN
eukprot:GFUD01024708.1.p1 GENE.GFUD01024708.1~~GFUD01024708.1.p1  ORF type:complete len:535 (+),score=145.77 GFUD01024708.1:24-1607(+)